MSKYTTEVRWVCHYVTGLPEETNPQTVIENSIPKIFDFSFPLFSEDYRTEFCTKILAHFYTREIGEETVGLWKYRLWETLNLIMPRYNKMYETTLIEVEPKLTRYFKKTDTESTTDTKNTQTNKSGTDTDSYTSTKIGSNSSKGSQNGDVLAKYSDTPMSKLSGVVDGTYLTSASDTVDIREDTREDSSTDTQNDTKEKEYTETVKGTDSGIATRDFSATEEGYDGNIGAILKEYRDSLDNIDVLVLNELEPLFMGIY